MSISLGIRHRESGEHQVVPIATNALFRRVWLPARERLGLSPVPLFEGGGLCFSGPNPARQVVSELEALRDWAALQPDGESLVDRCGDLLAAFERTDPEACDFDFGYGTAMEIADGVHVIPDLLTPEECREYIELTEARGTRRPRSPRLWAS